MLGLFKCNVYLIIFDLKSEADDDFRLLLRICAVFAN